MGPVSTAYIDSVDIVKHETLFATGPFNGNRPRSNYCRTFQVIAYR